MLVATLSLNTGMLLNKGLLLLKPWSPVATTKLNTGMLRNIGINPNPKYRYAAEYW